MPECSIIHKFEDGAAMQSSITPCMLKHLLKLNLMQDRNIVKPNKRDLRL